MDTVLLKIVYIFHQKLHSNLTFQKCDVIMPNFLWFHTCYFTSRNIKTARIGTKTETQAVGGRVQRLVVWQVGDYEPTLPKPPRDHVKPFLHGSTMN